MQYLVNVVEHSWLKGDSNKLVLASFEKLVEMQSTNAKMYFPMWDIVNIEPVEGEVPQSVIDDLIDYVEM